MTRANFDEIADWYAEQVHSTLAPFHELAIVALLDLAGEMAGREVCDLACGEGILTRALAARGARITGIDISRRLLTIAHAHEALSPLGITYRYDNAQELNTIPDSSFDLAACNLALMDIPDLAAVAVAVKRILRPGGAFIFSITHPCLIPPGSRWTTPEDGGLGRLVTGYFNEGYAEMPESPGVRNRVGTHHRTLTTYLNTFTAAGFGLERIAEPRAIGAAAERQPAATEAPMFLITRFIAL